MFLPTTKNEIEGQLDFVLVSADAYVDHPSFGHAVIGRVVQDAGYSIGIIAQPNWKSDEDFLRLGAPKYGFLVSCGNIDSMVAHYTVSKHRRKVDEYSPGGRIGLRPDRPGIVYTRKLKQLFPELPVAIGGLEASLRRFAHYDYWADEVKPSILLDSGADVCMYGMGERAVVELCDSWAAGRPGELIRGCCYYRETLEGLEEVELIPSFEMVREHKSQFNRAFAQRYAHQNSPKSPIIAQPHGVGYLVQMPPSLPLSTEELDHVYALPFERAVHPMYREGVPAIEEVAFSITAHRGCYGGCAFCSLIFHQGRIIQNRSIDSVVEEAGKLAAMPGFKGYIHDVGGPTANFHTPACKRQRFGDICKHRQCMFPTACPNIEIDHSEWMNMLRAVRAVPGVKKAFVRSGIRFDYLLREKDRSVLPELIEHHISGQLKIAPEHIAGDVLAAMGKPPAEEYIVFCRKYMQCNRELGLNQFIVPYFMSSHPGCRLEDAIELAVYLKENNLHVKQVQDFYPTPDTLATCIYHTGVHPLTGEKVFVARSPEQKAMQRALMQYFLPQNHDLIEKALRIAGRADLIGFEKNCLIRPGNSQKAEDKKRGAKTAGKRMNSGKKRRK